MSQLKKLAGQTAIYGLSSIIGRLLNYLLVPLYTRIFDPAAYGVVSEFYAYVTFLMILYTYGMETALFHFSHKRPDAEKVYGNGLTTLLLSSSLLSGALILFSAPLSSYLGYAEHPEYITWFALILAFDALTALPFAKLRLEGKAKQFAGLKLLNIFVNIGLNLFFLLALPHLAKANPDGFFAGIYNPGMGVGYVFLANLLASGITFLLLMPHYKRANSSPDWHTVKEMLVYAWPLLIAGFAGMINETLDRAVLKYLVTDRASAMEQLGIYSACYKLSILMTLFVQTFRYAADPFFFAQQHKEDSRKLFARIMNYFVLTCSVIFLGVMLFIDVVKLFIGEKFHSGLKVVPILLLANLCLGIYLNLSMWYKLSGKTRYGAWLSILGATVTIAFNFLLIPQLGYVGAAWATLICYSLMMVASYVKGQAVYHIPYQLNKLLVCIGLSIALWLIDAQIVSHVPMTIASGVMYHGMLLFLYIGLMWKYLSRDQVA